MMTLSIIPFEMANIWRFRPWRCERLGHPWGDEIRLLHDHRCELAQKGAHFFQHSELGEAVFLADQRF